MRYLVRQKVFSLGDNFTIRDDDGTDRFHVRGKLFSLGNRLRFFDMQERELYYIEQKLWRLLPVYHISSNGEVMAIVKRKFAFRPEFTIESAEGNLSVEGNLMGHDFTVCRDGAPAADISKKWFSVSDSYGVEIRKGENAPFLLALVIVLDQVLHDGRKR